MEEKETKLTNEQEKVVHSDKQNIFVLATAGSGKTTTMIQTVKYKINHHLVEPNRIYMTSFTNGDVDNTVRKLDKEGIGTEEDGVSVSTLHVLAQSLIKRIASVQSLNINDQDNFVDYHHTFAQYLKTHHQSAIDTFIAQLNQNGATAKNFKEQFECTFVRCAITSNKKHPRESEKLLIEKYRAFTSSYKEEFNQYLIDRNRISVNLDNTFILANLLLKKYPHLSSSIFPFDLLIIDESQDLSRKQLDFVKGLRQHFQFQLYMVGDLRQSIYGWRDADPAYYNEWIHTILREEKENAELLSLSTTFRLPNEASCRLPNAIFEQSALYDPSIHFPTKSQRHDTIVLDEYDDVMLFGNDIRRRIAEEYNIFYLEPSEKQNYDNVLNLVRKLIYVDHVEPYNICIVANRNATLYDLESHPYAHGHFAVPIGRDFLDYDVAVLKTLFTEITQYLRLWRLFRGNKKDEITIHHSYCVVLHELTDMLDELEQNDYVKRQPKDEHKMKSAFQFIHVRALLPLKKLITKEECTLSREALDSLVRIINRIKNETLDSIRKMARPRNQIAVSNICNLKGKEFDHVIYINDANPKTHIHVTENVNALDRQLQIDEINKMFVVLTRARQ